MNNDIRIEITDGRGKPPFWLALLRVSCFAAVMFGPGLVAGSAAMQWAGFVVLIVLLGLVLTFGHKREWLTLEQAKQKLSEM